MPPSTPPFSCPVRSSLPAGLPARAPGVLLAGVLLLAGPVAAQDAGPAAATAGARSRASLPAAAEEPPAFTPRRRPTLRIRPAAGPIEIDGGLEDAGWEGAAETGDFAEFFPGDNTRPPVDTRVWMAYDDDHLYVAFLARDDPSGIRASLRDRDEVFGDDLVGVMLDTYGDQTWSYDLFANPRGVQGDIRRTSAAGEDANFDMIYHTAGRTTPDGYQVEMAIPFESLRFPPGATQEWRLNFFRIRPRASRAMYSWAAIDRDDPCFMCQWGTLRGLEGVSAGGSLELLPSVVASQSGSLGSAGDPASGFENHGVDAEPSLGARYAFANGITAEATLNPDFSQVESDVGQIDANTTFALFFPEKRPFFQEGSDLLDTFFDAIYTRSINDPSAAAKMTARTGRTSLAYIGARDQHTPLLLPFEERSFVGQAGASYSNIVRARHALGETSYLGGLVTDRRLAEGGGAGTTAGADGAFRLGERYRLEWQLLGSRTREPEAPGLTAGVDGLTFDRGAHTAAFDGESYLGWAQYTSVEREARTWGFDVDYWARSPTFRADNGFEQRNDRREVILSQWLTLYPSWGFVDRVRPRVRASRAWNFAGVRKQDFLLMDVFAQLAGQTTVSAGHWRDPERFGGVELRGGWGWTASARSSFSDPLSLGFSVGGGEDVARFAETPFLADTRNFRVFGTLKPTPRLVLEPSVRYAELTGSGADCRPFSGAAGECTLFSGYIFRARAAYQFTRELFVRLVSQYDEFDHELSFEPLVTYKLNPYTLFFVGATDRHRDFGFDDGPGDGFHRTSRQFFAKFQYLFRI